MTKLFKTTVNDSWLHLDGIGHFTQSGTPRTVDGVPMVQMPHGLFPADGWHTSEQESIKHAAQRVEALGHLLLAQADRMRAEADKREVPA